MYNSINNNSVKRYFDIELVTDDGKKLNLSVENPKVKTLKKLENLNEQSTLDDLISVVSNIITKNKQNIHVTAEMIEDIFELDELYAFVGDFAEWLGDTKTADPN